MSGLVPCGEGGSLTGSSIIFAENADVGEIAVEPVEVHAAAEEVFCRRHDTVTFLSFFRASRHRFVDLTPACSLRSDATPEGRYFIHLFELLLDLSQSCLGVLLIIRPRFSFLEIFFKLRILSSVLECDIIIKPSSRR